MKVLHLNREQLEKRDVLLKEAAERFGAETIKAWMSDPVKRRLINAMAAID
jgi:hypothetical protein